MRVEMKAPPSETFTLPGIITRISVSEIAELCILVRLFAWIQ